jgi:hypothetical protein
MLKLLDTLLGQGGVRFILVRDIAHYPRLFQIIIPELGFRLVAETSGIQLNN